MLWNDHKIEIKVPSSGFLSDEEFFALCLQNPELKFERDKQGNILLMSPTGSESGNKNSEINAELTLWNREYKLGKVFDSSTGFKLPNGATRSPDASWVSLPRWEALSKAERKKFAPICPDFIIELMSESDELKELQEKMNEWIENGCRLGWLIDPENEQVFVYRPQKAIELVNGFENILSGEDVLPGFELDLELIKDIS